MQPEIPTPINPARITERHTCVGLRLEFSMKVIYVPLDANGKRLPTGITRQTNRRLRYESSRTPVSETVRDDYRELTCYWTGPTCDGCVTQAVTAKLTTRCLSFCASTRLTVSTPLKPRGVKYGTTAPGVADPCPLLSFGNNSNNSSA